VNQTGDVYPRMILITGDPQSGKSTLLETLISVLRGQHITTAGILAKGLWDSGVRSGFHLIDLKRNERVQLARRLTHRKKDSIAFEFFPSGIQAGQRALSRASCAGADVVIVDEVGRLETDGKGWAPLLPPLLKLDDMIHLWVVRTRLVETVCRIWHLNRPHIVRADAPGALDDLASFIMKTLKGVSHAEAQKRRDTEFI